MGITVDLAYNKRSLDGELLHEVEVDNFLAVNVVGVVDLNYSYVRVGYLTEVLVALLCVENRYGNCDLLDLRRDLRDVCGDHCSPISDTTIMASAGAQCDHVNHVSTQLPYAIVAAVVSFVTYIFAGFIQSPLCLIIGVALMMGAMCVVKMKFSDLKTE